MSIDEEHGAAAAYRRLDGDRRWFEGIDAPTAAASRPPLTTVHQDHREKGRTAARLLLGELGQPRSIVLPTHLVVRESTAEPYASAAER